MNFREFLKEVRTDGDVKGAIVAASPESAFAAWKNHRLQVKLSDGKWGNYVGVASTNLDSFKKGWKKHTYRILPGKIEF